MANAPRRTKTSKPRTVSVEENVRQALILARTVRELEQREAAALYGATEDQVSRWERKIPPTVVAFLRYYNALLACLPVQYAPPGLDPQEAKREALQGIASTQTVVKLTSARGLELSADAKNYVSDLEQRGMLNHLRGSLRPDFRR